MFVWPIFIVGQLAANTVFTHFMNELKAKNSPPVDENKRYQIDRGRTRIKTEHFK